MTTAYWAANWQTWASAICVLAIYSYLIKDNPVYRAMMLIFIGLNLGYQAVVQWRDVLYPQWWLPMVDGFHALFGGPGSAWGSLWALVGLIGLLFYFQLTKNKKYAWLSKIAIGVTIGIGAGLVFKSQLGQNIPQVVDTFRPLTPAMVRPQPRSVLRLPGSEFPLAVDGSLGFFVSGSAVTADEVLGGVQVWRADLRSAATGPAFVSGDRVIVPCASGPEEFDRDTGASVAGSVLPPASLPSGDFQFKSEGRDLSILDAATHKQQLLLHLPGAITATPVVATFRQPQYSNGVVLVPIGDTIDAYAFRESVVEGVHAGDLLWTQRYDQPIVSVQPFEGVALVSGARASTMWELPNPRAQLSAGDLADNWVTVITVVCVMTYFFFSFRRGPVTNGASNVGRWMLMIGFGAFFGNTVMTRMSFLVDRLMFLIDDWLRPFFHQFFR